MKRKRWSVRFLSFFVGLGAVGLAAGVAVERSAKSHIVVEAEAPERSVAIVLGAAVHPSGYPSGVLADRLQLALDLYKAGKVKHILVSGDNDGRGIDEVNPMRTWLIDHGVPSSAIYMDHAGFRTHDTMQRAAKVFGVKDAIVCTQDFHLARSVFLARAAGIDAVGIPAQERRWRTTTKAQTRETAARMRAAADVAIGIQPKYLGEKIPVGTAAASRTHDTNTRS